MSELIFSSDFYSISGVNYKVELTGETYTGLDADIIGGTGFVWHVDKDWTDYLQNLQSIELRDQDEIDEVGTGIILGASVTSFSYNENEDRTEITLTTAFDSNFVRITSVSFFPSFDPDITSLETTWDKEGDIILEAIKASSTELTYSNNDAWFDRFFELFLRSDDDELKVQIFKDDGGFKREWVGNLVHDLMEYENTSKPRPYTFKVIDGIDMLKDVPYAEALTGASEQPLISHIITLLGYINTAQFWGSDPYIRESIEFTSKDVPGLGISDSPLEYTFLDDRHFIERKEKREEKNEALDVYDSLRAVLELMSCRIFQAKGIWWIQQIRNFANPTSVVFREFTNSIGAPSTQSQYNHKLTVGSFKREEDLVLMTSGTFRYLEGLLNVKLVANKGNEVLTGEDATSINLGFGKLTGEKFFSLGTVFGGVGSNASVRVEFVLQELFNQNVGFEVDCSLEIVSDIKYIKGGDAIDPLWKEDQVEVDRFWIKRVHQSGSGNKTKVVFETPEIPFDDFPDATLRLGFEYKGSTVGSQTYFSVSNFRVLFPSAEKPERIDTGNPNTAYTKELDLGEMIIDDLSRLTSVAIVMVDDEFTTVNPRNLIEAINWDAGFPEGFAGVDEDGEDRDESLTLTRVVEAMSFQQDPIEQVQITIEGEYYGFNSLSYNDKIYAFNGFRIDYLTDESEGTWFEVRNARENIAISQVVKQIPVETRIPDAGGEDKGWSNNFRNNVMIVATTDGITEATGSDIGQINIEPTGHSRFKNGDAFQIVHSVTNAVFGDFVVNGDVGPTDTVMGIVEQTIEFDITDQMRLIFTKGEVVESNIVRSDNFIDKTTGGRLFVAGSNTEIQYNDNDSSGASPDFTWNDGLKELGVKGQLRLLENNVGIIGVSTGVLAVDLLKLDDSDSVNLGVRTNILSDLVSWTGANTSKFEWKNHEDDALLMVIFPSRNAGVGVGFDFGARFTVQGQGLNTDKTFELLDQSNQPHFSVLNNSNVDIDNPSPSLSLVNIKNRSNFLVDDPTSGIAFANAFGGHVGIFGNGQGKLVVNRDSTLTQGEVLANSFGIDDTTKLDFNISNIGAKLQVTAAASDTVFIDLVGSNALTSAISNLVGVRTSSVINASGGAFTSVGTQLGVALVRFSPYTGDIIGTLISPAFFVDASPGGRRVILDVGDNTGGEGNASTHTSIWSTHRGGGTIFGHPTNVPSATIDNFGDFVNSNVVVLADEATPSIAGTNVFKTGGTTTITDFDDGVVGKQIQILAKHTIIITDSVDIQLDGGTDFAMSPGNTLTLRMFDDQIWNEVGRV